MMNKGKKISQDVTLNVEHFHVEQNIWVLPQTEEKKRIDLSAIVTIFMVLPEIKRAVCYAWKDKSFVYKILYTTVSAIFTMNKSSAMLPTHIINY